MASQAQPLNVLFFPLMAPGHMLPMLNMAKLLAARGVNSTILTTHANAPLVRPSIGPHIKLHLIDFPSGTGLPEGAKICRIFRGSCSTVLKLYLNYNMHYELNMDSPSIPILFTGSNLFASCILDCTTRFKPYEHAVPDADSFVILGLPHRIEVLKSPIPDVQKIDKVFIEMFSQMKETEPKSYGVVGE